MRNTRDGSSSKHDDEEDCALTTKGKGRNSNQILSLKSRSWICPK
jgi:hypothetical protein